MKIKTLKLPGGMKWEIGLNINNRMLAIAFAWKGIRRILEVWYFL